MMWGWEGHGGTGWLDWAGVAVMMGFGLLVLVGLTLLIVWAVRSASGSGGDAGSGLTRDGGGDRALDIARERLARGEIDSEEYARIRDALGR